MYTKFLEFLSVNEKQMILEMDIDTSGINPIANPEDAEAAKQVISKADLDKAMQELVLTCWKRIRWAQSVILVKYPFFGSMLAHLPLRLSFDIPTMATDGRCIMFNPVFTMQHLSNNDELLFVVCHEIMHNALKHFQSRRPDRELQNIAQDYAINALLHHSKSYDTAKNKEEPVGKMPKGVLYDEKYLGMTWEAIYDLLEPEWTKNKKQQQQQQQHKSCPTCKGTGKNPNQQQGQSGQSGKSGQSQSSKQGQSGQSGKSGQQGQSGKQGQSGDGSCPTCKGTGKDPGQGQGKGGDGQGTFGGKGVPKPGEDYFGKGDVKPAGSLGEADNKKGDIEGEGKGGDGQESLEKTLEGLAKKWEDRLMDAFRKEAGKGSIKGALVDHIRAQSQPKVNWKQQLKQFISEILSEVKFTFPARRFLSSDLAVTGSKREPAVEHPILIIDTSGSISQREMDAFAAELKGIEKAKSASNVHVMYADDNVQHVEDFRLMKDVKLRKTPGGGTDFRPAFKHIQNEYIAKGKTPAFIIYFTDAYGAFPEDFKLKKKVIWAIVQYPHDNTEHKIPFGKVLKIPVGQS